MFFQEPGGFSGLVFGYMLGALFELNKRLEKLEDKFFDIEEPETSLVGQEAQAPIELDLTIDAIDNVEVEKTSQPVEPPPLAPERLITTDQPDDDKGESAASSTIERDPPPSLENKIIEYVKSFFTQGNVVVRIGVIVLFFGVTFLLKYAADNSLVPIELRLFAVAVGALAMEIVGWHLRHKRPTYSVIMQGGAIGVLYLNVFAAAKIYGLLPLTLAFLIMVGIVSLSGILAVLQNAKPLAIFGAIGGFLAPVLVSTGEGNHVVLFSYYALLNAGIVGIAWFKAWRMLNWIGFVFTFIIGTAWGVKDYQPSYFASTEPFLVLFFLFYSAISVLFAYRQPPNLKGYVDGTLVFALPLCVFGLQSGLVHDYQYGMAISALCLGLYYIFLAMFLWKRMAEGMRVLSEAFLSLGVIFGSLTIPLALDSSWTACLWCVEGAALVWIGLRQQRLLARSFGLLLQLGASIAFVQTVITTSSANMVIVVNGIYMSCLLLSLSGLISSICLKRYGAVLWPWKNKLSLLLMAWGLAW